MPTLPSWSKAQLQGANEVEQALSRGMGFTLDDGIRWEGLGLGRVFFENGRATFYTSPDFNAYAENNDA